MTTASPTERHAIDADLRRRTDEFLASNPSLSKKLDDLDKLMMGNYLQTQLQQERNGWRGSLSKAMEELERHRKLYMQTTGSGAEDEYQLQRQFTDYMEEEQEKETEPEPAEVEPEAESTETVQLREQLSAALEKASAASELSWHYENFIRELKSINGKLEARLTQLAHERRKCIRVLASGVAEDALSGVGNVDLYKAIRELQSRCEQLSLEQQQQPRQQKQPEQPHHRTYCSACGSAISSSTPMSDGDTNGKNPHQQHHQQQQQPQASQRDQIVTKAIFGWKRGVRVFAAGKPTDIAIVPLRPRLQQRPGDEAPGYTHTHTQQQQQPQVHPTDDATQTDQQQPDPLAESLTENARLRKDLHALAKSLRTAEEDAKEKAAQLAAYEKQVASMKHAFTYRQPPAQPPQPDPTSNPPITSTAADVSTVNNSLPILNLARNTQKRSRGSQQQSHQQQQQQQQQQQVMPAKTSVTRCLRCHKLYRLVDNNKFACKYHSKGRQRLEQHSSQGRLADVLFVWDCCGRLANAEGCCFSEHI